MITVDNLAGLSGSCSLLLFGSTVFSRYKVVIGLFVPKIDFGFPEKLMPVFAIVVFFFQLAEVEPK